MNDLIFFYSILLVVSFIVCGGWIGAVLLAEINEEPFDSKKAFFHYVFLWQYFVWKARRYLNLTGTLILEIFTTVFCWHLNIIVFLILSLILFLKFLCYLYMEIFKRRD